jgi:hypothetical protein
MYFNTGASNQAPDFMMFHQMTETLQEWTQGEQ